MVSKIDQARIMQDPIALEQAYRDRASHRRIGTIMWGFSGLVFGPVVMFLGMALTESARGDDLRAADSIAVQRFARTQQATIATAKQ